MENNNHEYRYNQQDMNGYPSNQQGNQNAQQSSPYQSPYGAGQQSGYADAYGNSYSSAQGTYQQSYAYQQTTAQPKPKKEKKPGGFGVKLGKCAAMAAVFGLVAGGVFTGVSYAGMHALGVATEASTDAVGGNGVVNTMNEMPNGGLVEQTSTGMAKDLVNVSSIVKEVVPGIVAITNTSMVTYQSFFGGYQQYEAESCGSGIIVSQDEDYLYIATNNHVVSGAKTLSVQFVNDVTVEGEIQGTYAANDLAVVKVKRKDIDSGTLSQIKQVTIGNSDELEVGEATIAIGNALGYGQSTTTGIVSALNRSITVQDETTRTATTCDNLIQTDAAINPGNSGGALLNEKGELIGINSAKYSDTSVEGIGYAIPINEAMEIVNALIAGESLEKVQTAYLGIGGSNVSSDVAAAYGLPEGVYVKNVYEGSGAAKAGLCQGDIITAIDGKEIKTMTELQTLLTDYEAGDTVNMTVWRMNNGYQSMEVSVVLSDASVLQESEAAQEAPDEGNQSFDDNGADSRNNNGFYDGFGDFDFGFGW